MDWDWRRGLTVWTLTGRLSESQYRDKVLRHELSARPASEREAQAEARRWWAKQGRAAALAAVARGSDARLAPLESPAGWTQACRVGR